MDRLIENRVGNRSGNPLERFFENVKDRWNRQGRTKELGRWADYEKQFLGMLRLMTWESLREPYYGTNQQRAALRDLTSFLVDRYAQAVSLAKPQQGQYGFQPAITKGSSPIVIEDSLRLEVTMLKELTWTYVIEASFLAVQQEGQRLIVRGLYQLYTEAANRGDWRVFPTSMRNDLQSLHSLRKDPAKRARVVIDLIANLTEVQAVELYHRLTGVSSASLLNRIQH